MREIIFNSQLKEFYDIALSKKCVCFGAGRKLDEISRDIEGFVDLIDYVVDNNSDLNMTERKIQGKSKIVHNVDFLAKDNVSDILLVITSSYKDEIIDQLNGIDTFSELTYCEFEKLFDHIAWNAKKPPSGFKKNEYEKIPKKIHYIWFSNNPIPKRLQSYIDGWKRLCEDYEICCWNEANYDVSKNAYMYQAYKDKRWSFVSDYARLDIVYQHGGIYLDTDVELIRRPDELLFNDAFIGFERLSTVNTGAGFGAKQGHPIIKELRDFYNDIKFNNASDPNDMILCPVYETAILKKHGLVLNGDFQIVDDMTVYPVMYFNAKSLYSDRLQITEETVSVHHCSWTWAGSKSKL